MTTAIKRHWLLIVLTVVLFSALALVLYRCGHHAGSVAIAPGGSLSPANSAAPVDPTASTPATITSLLTDPTTLGAIITAIATALGLAWKALQKKDLQGVVQAVSTGVASVENLKESIKAGVPLSPSVEKLAEDLHEAGREAVLKGQTIAREQGMPVIPFTEWADCTENVKEGRRVQARWLLAKYTITVKP